MCMQDSDLEILDEMIREYHVKDLLRALRNSINKHADELVDADLKDDAKILSLASHHLSIFVGE